MEELFFFDRNGLVDLAKANRNRYESADPFPSICLDDFLPPTVASAICEEFPKADFTGLAQPDNPFQKGKRGRSQDKYFLGLSPFIRHMLNEFNGLAFIDFLEELTGIRGLIPDTHFRGGAVHQVLPGGSLAIHADFNHDKYRKLDRRINVLLYFNKDWKDRMAAHSNFGTQR